jgi:hypothetical protein
MQIVVDNILLSTISKIKVIYDAVKRMKSYRAP